MWYPIFDAMFPISVILTSSGMLHDDGGGTQNSRYHRQAVWPCSVLRMRPKPHSQIECGSACGRAERRSLLPFAIEQHGVYILQWTTQRVPPASLNGPTLPQLKRRVTAVWKAFRISGRYMSTVLACLLNFSSTQQSSCEDPCKRNTTTLAAMEHVYFLSSCKMTSLW